MVKLVILFTALLAIPSRSREIMEVELHPVPAFGMSTNVNHAMFDLLRLRTAEALGGFRLHSAIKSSQQHCNLHGAIALNSAAGLGTALEGPAWPRGCKSHRQSRRVSRTGTICSM